MEVIIYEKVRDIAMFDKNTSSPKAIELLKEKYGYTFPAHIKMPPPPPAPPIAAIHKLPPPVVAPIAPIAPDAKMSSPTASAPIALVSAKTRNLPPPPPFDSEYKGLIDYLSQNVKYPADAISNHTAGTGIVQYTLDADHKIANVSILKSTNPVFDKEVENKMESFKDQIDKTPGTYTLGFRFSIAGETNNNEAREGDREMSQQPNYTGEISIVGNAN